MKRNKIWRWLLLPAASAVLLVTVGLVCLAWPAGTLGLLPRVLGLGLVAAGLVQLWFYFGQRSLRFLPEFGWIVGAASLLVGAVFLFNPHVSMVFVGICGGIWSIVLSLVRGRAALRKRDSGRPWKTHLAGCGLYLACGVGLLFSPFTGGEPGYPAGGAGHGGGRCGAAVRLLRHRPVPDRAAGGQRYPAAACTFRRRPGAIGRLHQNKRVTLYILHKYESAAEFLSCGGCFFAKTDYCIKYADKKTNQFLIFVQMHNEKPIDLCKTTMYNKLVPKGREQVEPAAKSGGETGLYFGRRIVPAADAAVCRTAAPHRKVEESMEWKMSRKLIKILAESACVMTMTSESDSRYTLIGRL